MNQMKNNPSKKRHPKKHRDVKKEAIRQVHMAGFDKETSDDLIKEIEEICAFEDSLEA